MNCLLSSWIIPEERAMYSGIIYAGENTCQICEIAVEFNIIETFNIRTLVYHSGIIYAGENTCQICEIAVEFNIIETFNIRTLVYSGIIYAGENICLID